MKWWWSLALVVIGVLAACGSKDRAFEGDGSSGGNGPGDLGGPPIANGDTLAVEPKDALLEVADGKIPTLAYQAFLVHPDGTRADATAAAHFHVDGTTYGSFTGPTFTASPNGVGKTRVHADRSPPTPASRSASRRSSALRTHRRSSEARAIRRAHRRSSIHRTA